MLLLDDLNTEVLLNQDSIHVQLFNHLSEMVQNPETYWPHLIQEAIHFGLKVLAAFIVYTVGIYAIKYIKHFLNRLFEYKKADKTLTTFVTSLVSITLTILLVVATIGTLGINTSSFAALLTGGSMAIALTLQGTVQNFAGGIVLLIFKPFKAHDFISAMGVSGTVTEVSIVSTKIQTPDNRLVILPNGALANSAIDNYTAKPYRRVEFLVSLAYGTDAAAAKQAILQQYEGDERILHASNKHPHPDPFVALKSLNSSDITFVSRVWVKAEDYWPVYFEYTERFYTELPKQGFEFAFPHMDVTMLS